jgi:hypothetical protein
MVAGHTKEGPATTDDAILKHKSDSAKFQKDATILKFPSGNQSEKDNPVISKLDAEKCAIHRLSEENRCKLLLFGKCGYQQKMSDCKLQKCLFDSAKTAFKYGSNQSMHYRLFQSFYNQLVSILSSAESFECVL